MTRPNYSARVDLWLTRGGERIELAQVGPTFVITDTPELLSVGDEVTVHVSVDGRENHMHRPVTVTGIEGKRVWTEEVK